MSRLDTLARRSSSELHSEVKSVQVPHLDLRRIREHQIRRTIRTSVLAVAAVVVVVGVPIWLGASAPEEPVTTPTTVPGLVTTIPDVQEEGKLTVETSLGTWQWVRGDQPGLGLPDAPGWVELPEPPLPEIEELVWPQFEDGIGGDGTGPFPSPTGVGGFPVASDDKAITIASVVGHIDWTRFYAASDGWVESRFRPLDGDCAQPEICPTETATLEIFAVDRVGEGEPSYRTEILDVLVASIIPGDPDAVEYRDEDTGDLVLRLESTDDLTAQKLLQSGQACVSSFDGCNEGLQLLRLHVEGVGWVEPPWQGIDLRWGVEAGARNGGFWVVAIEDLYGPSGTLHAWGSLDGVNWQQIASPYSLDGLLAHGQQGPMQLVNGELVILTPAMQENGPPVQPQVLRLLDGQFTKVDVDLSPVGLNEGAEITDFSAAPWGWVATTWAQTCRVWISPNGNNWEEVTTPDGTDTAETVNVQSWTFNDDGSGVAEAPGTPTPAESVAAEVAGSSCSLTDDGVYLGFEHLIKGVGTVHEGENYQDFYYTSWLGGFADGGG